MEPLRPHFSYDGSHIDRPVHFCNIAGSGNAVDIGVISDGGVETLRLNDKRYTVAHGADLQQFLAVAQGRQALVELSAEDVQPCHRSKARVCQLPRAVTKKASHQSCVELLFFN